MTDPSTATRTGASGGVRRDLQGLRGIGVAFVVVGHLWQQPVGAYAVLDMFFVLSGFWITPILVRGLREHGARFTIAFYLNRVRRLMPAAVLVIAVTTLLFYVVYSSARGRLVGIDGLWAFAFLANWHYIAVGSDYFHDTSPSPFVHYWSLSVEEQFYAVWPFLILLVLVVARPGRRWLEALLGLLGVVTVVSFGYSLWHSPAAPVAAYFSTFDRIWEFGIGGMLGLLSARFARMPLWLGAGLGWVGLVGIVVTVFVIPLGLSFPAPWGLVPVLLTGAILVGGIGRDTRYLRVLDNPVMVYLGDISYSLYLWHLPLAVLLTAWFPLGDPMFYVTAIVISFGAAIATYHLVERPMRYARPLMTPPERAAYRPWPQERKQQSRQVGLVALALTVGTALCAVALVPPPVVASGPRPTQAAAPRASSPAPMTLADRQQERVLDALDRTDFPELHPGLDGLGADALGTDHPCFNVQEADLGDCRWGDGRRLAVVVGDSFAVAWTDGIRQALVPHGWVVQSLTMGQCPAWTLPSYLQIDGTKYPECADHHRLVRDFIAEHHPDLVVLASAWQNVRNAEREDLTDDGWELAHDALTDTIEDLAPLARRLVVLGSPPPEQSLVECKTRVGNPADCVAVISDQWREVVDAEQDAAEGLGVRFVATGGWFCASGRCPAFVGTTPVTYDGAHVTAAYSRELAPLLREALVGNQAR